MAIFEELALETGLPLWLLTLAIIWTLVWKAFALWKSARRNSPIWFVVLLVVNTLGILEILYIFLFSEINLDAKPKSPKRSKKKTARRRARRR